MIEGQQRIIDYSSFFRFSILVLIFSLNGCVYTCIPIIFYRPNFFCENEPGQFEHCDESVACNSRNFRVESEYPQISSLTIEFELYCDRRIIEATILTMMAAGQILAFVIGTAVYISPKNQYTIFIYGSLITGLLLISSYYATNAYFLIPILFFWNAYYGLYMSIIFAHLNFFFSGVLSKFGPSIFNTAWPAFMLIYCLFTYYFGTWRDSLVFFAGIPYIILTGLLVFFKQPPPRPLPVKRDYLVTPPLSLPPKKYSQKQKKKTLNKRLLDLDSRNISFNSTDTTGPIRKKELDKLRETNAWEDFKNQLMSIYENDQYFKNVGIFVLCYIGTNIAYFGCLLVMSDLGGNIYTNITFGTLFEFVGNLSATFLILKFPERSIIKIAFLIVGISYISCLVFDPTKHGSGDNYSLYVLISLLPIIIAKGTHEMLWTVLQTYLNTILPPEFHQFSFACSNLLSVCVIDLLPFYKFFMESINFNQFVGYGVYCLFIYYICQFFEDLFQENGKPLPTNTSDIEIQIQKSQQQEELVKMSSPQYRQQTV